MAVRLSALRSRRTFIPQKQFLWTFSVCQLRQTESHMLYAANIRRYGKISTFRLSGAAI
jgi:hypothetical protein